MNEMTDKQIEIILNLVADKFSKCEDMEEVKKAIEEVKEMAKKEKPNNQAKSNQKGGELVKAAQTDKSIIKGFSKDGKTKKRGI